MRTELLQRKYHTIDGHEVLLVIHCPTVSSEGPDLECNYEIRGLSQGDLIKSAGGTDGIQCVLLAMQMAAAFLIASSEYQARQLYWKAAGNPDLGLPLSKYGAQYGWQ